MQVGGKDGHGIVAFETETGKVRWKATDHEAGYSSPTVATIGERRYALFFTRSGLVATDPRTGQLKIQFPWRSREHASVNAATSMGSPTGVPVPWASSSCRSRALRPASASASFTTSA